MAAAPSRQPLVGGLRPGSRILVFYETDVVWLTRYLLAQVDRDSWIILTPDGDIYCEEVSDGNADWVGWRVWPVGSPAPYGVEANLIYGFNPAPDQAAMRQLLEEGEHHAAQERLRLGLANHGPHINQAVPGVVANPGPAPLVGGHAGGGVANLAGGDQGGVGGNPAVPGGAQVVGDPHGHAGLSQVLAGGAGDVGLGVGGAGGHDDARTLPISRDSEGLRFKEFRVACQESKPTDFKDWPVSGPRTTKYVLSQMLEHGGSAIGHHQAWRVACKFAPTDAPAQEHEAWSKVLQTMMTYDQLDVSNLASGELVVRALQRIEEKHKFKLASVDDAGEGALFMGATSGTRAGSIISPKLTEWIGSEMQKDALVAKERRKAREERALSRKSDKDEKK
eukprot:symbB.v1.2.005111.t1/scaffold294.1/size237520/9